MRYARGEAILRVIAMRYAPQLIVSQNERLLRHTSYPFTLKLLRSHLCLKKPTGTVPIASLCYNDWYMKEDQRPYQERIIADPRILAGKPVVKGTRIAVDLVLEELAQNPAIDELLAAHPALTRDDVQACLAYAKAIVTGEEVSPKPPKGARSDAAL
jgi:uncharacterized protein (DUF433 family)